jgi:hypothetical protein
MQKSKEKKNGNMKWVVGIGLLVVLLIAMWGVYQHFSEKGTVGQKHITLEVVNAAGDSTNYEVNTDGAYLIDAMGEAKGLSYEGEESAYGLMIHTVNGERADAASGAYWSFSVNGEYCNYGADAQPITDGDKFCIAYTKL